MRQKRLYLKLTDLAFERIKNKTFEQQAGRCIVCNNKLHKRQRKFCCKFCRNMYTNAMRSKHHLYDEDGWCIIHKWKKDWNCKDILLAFKEINLSDYEWKL